MQSTLVQESIRLGCVTRDEAQKLLRVGKQELMGLSLLKLASPSLQRLRSQAACTIFALVRVG